MPSSLGKFLKSKVFFFNLIAALLVISVTIYLLYDSLNDYTHHGESITVPDLRGLTQEKLARFIENKHLKFDIVDSLFEVGKVPGTVLEQDPAPNSKVKENRTIYLTVNASQPPKVKMPNLIDVSFRQAEAILQTFGLKVGSTIYKPDLAKNAVLAQLYRGEAVEPGKDIFKGSVIDLVLGDGIGNAEMDVPNLIGLQKGMAMFVLKGSSLNPGTITFDPTVKNEDAAKVYKQSPEAGVGVKIKQGEAIDLYLR